MSGDDDTSGWYVSGAYPELRSGPPFVMEEMIAAQRSLPEAIAEQEGDAAALAGAIEEAVTKGDPLTLVACGTSEHAAQAVALILDEALRARGAGGGAGEGGAGTGRFATALEARQALDAELAPRGGLLIAISHGGLSKATVRAAKAARARGATIALVTAAERSSALDVADLVVKTPLVDASLCHTVGYTSPILVGLLVSSLLRGESYPASDLAAYLGTLYDLAPQFTAAATGLWPIERLAAAGSGADLPTARELALKVAEGARLATATLDLENVLHGHLVGHDSSSGLVVVVTAEPASTRRAERAGEVLAGANCIGLKTAAIVTDELSATLSTKNGATSVLALPSVPGDDGSPRRLRPLERTLLGGAIALQCLTVGLVHAREVNPDLIRREEQPYRDAVSLGMTKLPRE